MAARAVTLVSVIMATRNNDAYLEAAVASLAAQTHTDWELVAVDDCSTDTTPAILERLSAADSRIRVFRNETNLRLARTRNRAIAEARGPYLAILDSDDEREPSSLEQQVAFMERNPGVVALGTGCQWCDEAMQRMNDRLYPLTDAEIRRTFLRYSPFCVPSLMIRASAVEGPAFDPAMHPADDIDGILRLGEKGKFANLPGTLYRLRTHASSMSQVEVRAQERKTFQVRRKAVREYGYHATIGDIAWNAGQAATMYLMPGWWRFRLFNRLRSSN
jgi:glycosyltransferase involved in cell wall biosynthesis